MKFQLCSQKGMTRREIIDILWPCCRCVISRLVGHDCEHDTVHSVSIRSIDIATILIGTLPCIDSFMFLLFFVKVTEVHEELPTECTWINGFSFCCIRFDTLSDRSNVPNRVMYPTYFFWVNGFFLHKPGIFPRGCRARNDALHCTLCAHWTLKRSLV